jgi:hypothetical protein
LAYQRLGRRSIEAVEYGGILGWAEMLTQYGGAANISEEDCDVDFRAAGRKVLTSGAAYPRIFSRRTETKHSN